MDTKITAAIVDDEQGNRENLLRMIGNYCPQIRISAICSSVTEARTVLPEAKPDILFLDIRFSALDYLLKPIDPEELTHAVDKAVQVVLRKQENKRMQNLLQNTQALDKQKKIALSVADKIEFVEIGSIIRCESESNYTTFYLKSGEKLIVSKTLKEFDELLAPYHFLRVHQSHLINLDEIKSFIKSDGGYIRMKDGASVSISRQRRNYVMEVLKQL